MLSRPKSFEFTVVSKCVLRCVSPCALMFDNGSSAGPRARQA